MHLRHFEERLKLKCTKAAIISIYKLGSAFTTVVLLRNKHDKNTGHHSVTVVSGGGKQEINLVLIGKEDGCVECNGKLQENLPVA